MSSRNAVAEFNYYLDKATSPRQADTDYYAINKICWMIDEAMINPEDAIQAIHGKIIDENPEAVMYALKILNAVFYKCGSLAHKVICTDFYMSLLKETIQTTEYKTIKDTILSMLQEWAENFKYFPQYGAPQKLLQELKNNEVSKNGNECKNEQMNEIHQPSLKQTNSFHKMREQSTNNTEKFDKNRLNETNLDSTKSTTSCESGNNELEIELKKRDESFKKALQEYRRKKKMQYNNHRKTLGLPPLSSDEEDNNYTKKETKISQVSNLMKKEEDAMQLKSPPCRLTKELQQIKLQRERLNNDIQQCRASKHVDYVQLHNDASMEMQQCTDKNCENCKKIKSTFDEEEYFVPKRFPYDIQKIIDSKHRIKKEFEDIKKIKQDAYYKNKTLSSVKTADYNQMELNAYELKDSESEDEDLQKAILLSKKEMMSKPMIVERKQEDNSVANTQIEEDMDEEKMIEKAIALSRLDTRLREVNPISVEQKQESHEVKNIPISVEEDDEMMLKRAFAISRLDARLREVNSMTAEQNRLSDAIKKTPAVEDMDEEKMLEEAIAISKLETGTEKIDENGLLQQAINESFIEEEDKHFSPMSKTNEDVMIDYVKRISLNDPINSISAVEDSIRDEKNLHQCCICHDMKILKTFMPCNHKCICEECSMKYISQICPMCRKYYTSIIFDF